MVRRVKTSDAAAVKLLVPAAVALGKLETMIAKGMEIRRTRIRYLQDLDRARAEKLRWTEATTDGLTICFEGSTAADEFNSWVGKILPEYAEPRLFVEQFHAELDFRLQKLQTIQKRTQKFAETVSQRMADLREEVAYMPPIPAGTPTSAMSAPPQTHPTSVTAGSTPQYVPINGDSDGLDCLLLTQQENEAEKDLVVQFVDKLGVHAIAIPGSTGASEEMITRLDEQRTIGFAVVFLSAEAAAAARKPEESKDSAVLWSAVFSLGYCAGRLGRDRICVLYHGGSEVFTDSLGITYIPIDQAGTWQFQLAKQMKRAGIPVDLNRVF